MNRHYISRFVLMIVLLLGVCARGWADGETVIFSEDFSGFPSTINKYITHKGWIYNNSSYNDNVNAFLVSYDDLTSPIFGFSEAATISFQYANANKAQNNLRVTLSIICEESILHVETFDVNNIYTNPYYTKSVTIDHGASNVKVIISKSKINQSGIDNGLFIKDFKITTSTYTLSQSWNNSYALNAQKGNTVDVTLSRTFPANTWCTLCLPFDVTASSIGTACGTDAPLLRVFSDVEGNTMKFTAPTEGTVSAGTPFLLKFSADVTTSPVFSGVTISKTGDAVTPAAMVAYGDYSFIGTYSPTEIPAAGWFLKADGKLYQPGPETEGGDVNLTLAGLRAYFTLPTTASGARPVVSIAGDDATTVGIAVSTAPSVEAIYTLGGLPVASPKSPGIYIVRRTDGSTQKITIR